MDLAGFIDKFKDAIAQRVVESYPPLYRPSENGRKLPGLLRTPLGAQADAIRGAALSLEAHRGTTVVGEMGTGKTFIGAAAAHMAGFRRILVLCPPHLTEKWKREVEETVPGARAAIVTSITELEKLRYSAGSGPLFVVMSRERAKLSYRWKPAVVLRWATSGGWLLRDEETGEPFRVPRCPDCNAQIVDRDGVPLTNRDLSRRKRTCAVCGTAPLAGRLLQPSEIPALGLRKAPDEGLLRPADRRRGPRVQGPRLRPGNLRRRPGRRLRKVPQPERDPDGRLLLDALPPALPVLAGDKVGVRAVRGATLDHTVRLRGGHRRQVRRRRLRGRPQQPTPQLPQGDKGAAGTGPVRPLPHHRQHRLPQAGRRGLGTSRLRRADPRLPDGLGGGRDRVLPAQRLQRRVRGTAEAAGRGPQEGLQAAAGDVPSDPAGLPRRLHEGRDGPRSRKRGHHRPGPAPVGGQALPEGEGPGRPRGRGADGGTPGAGLRDAHGDQGHHRADGRHPHPARLSGSR